MSTENKKLRKRVKNTIRSRQLGVILKERGKDPYDRKPYKTGQHGLIRRNASSDFGIQLHEKQKIKAYYCLSERQIKGLFKKAQQKKGDTSVNLMRFIEARLDVFVYRSGLARTYKEAQQLVSHGHVAVNGRTLNIRSYHVRQSDAVSLSKTGREHKNTLDFINSHDYKIPAYISSTKDHDVPTNRVTNEYSFNKLPDIEEIKLPFDYNLNKVIEFLSK